jgi:hypothetical protein
VNKQKEKKNDKAVQGNERDGLMTTDTEKRLDILTGAVLFVFGVYQSILYFGHTVVPISDFPDLYKVGSDLLAFHRPARFMQAPVLGLLQNFLYPISWGTCRELTAGWLLNAILHPFNLVLLWLVGKRIIGRSAIWLACILIINHWTIYLLTEPIIETTYLFFILLTFYLIFARTGWAYLAASITTMVRYEGAALIMAAFIADIIHRKDRRDVIRAFLYSFLASVPLVVWLAMTAITWQKGSTHYLTVLLSNEYSKGFSEPVANRTGIGLNMMVLWQTGFASLFMPGPGTSQDMANAILSASKVTVPAGFVLGCFYSVIRRQWQVWMLLLFFVPYFILHARYPYPLPRFHSTIIWIVMLICWLGLQSVWRSAAGKLHIPRQVVLVIQVLIAAIAIVWLTGLVPYMPKIASFSPRSASMPYAAMAVVLLISIGRFYTGKIQVIPGTIAVMAVMGLMIVSNQFALVRLLGDGQREVEFRQLGEWFAKNAKPGEKMALYNCGTAQLFAGKYADNLTSFPKVDNPEQLTEELYKEGLTYVVWATREGMSTQHTGYKLLNLDKNLVMLSKPRSVGPYEFITQVGSDKGYVNIFRLKQKSQ